MSWVEESSVILTIEIEIKMESVKHAPQGFRFFFLTKKKRK